MSILDFVEERRCDESEATHILCEEFIKVERNDIEEMINFAWEDEQEVIELFCGESVILSFKIKSEVDYDIIIKALMKHMQGITHHTEDLLECNVTYDPFIVKFPRLKCSLPNLKDIASSFLKCIDDINIMASIDFDIYEYGIPLLKGKTIDFQCEELDVEDKAVSINVSLGNIDEIHEVLFKYNPKFHDTLSICEDLLRVLGSDVDQLKSLDKEIIGQILFNESKGSQRGCYVWNNIGGEGWDDKHITLKSNKKLKIDQYGIKTLRTIVKRHNKVGYKKWLEKYLKHYVGQCLKPTSSFRSVANLLYQIYMEKFICEGVKDGIWYVYKGTRHVLLDDAVIIKSLLSTKIRKRFESFYGTEAQEYAIKLMKNLESPSFKSSVMKEASELFYVSKFLREKDTNVNLFAMKNLVFDCGRKDLRQGYPDDWITLRSGVKYRHYDEDEQDVKDLFKFLSQVFVNESVRNYIALTWSSCLQGGNNDKSFYIMSGQKSNNSKSTVICLLTICFGTYSVSPDSSLITNKLQINPNAPSPALETLRNRRIAFFQEPSPDESINIGFVKKLTSKYNKFTSRAPFGKELIEFTIQLKPFVECNEIPYISMEPAVRRRTKIIDFQSEFVDDPPTTEEEQYKQKKFKIDVNFEENFKRLAPVLMWYLIKIFKEKETKGIIPPDSVISNLGKFEKVNDHFALFCEEVLDRNPIRDEDKISDVKVKNLYIAYSSWYKNSNIKKPIISKDRFYTALEKEKITVDTSQQPHRVLGVSIRQI